MALKNSFTTKQSAATISLPFWTHRMSRLSTFAANPKTGYSNLFNHVMKVHPDYLSTMKMSGFNSGTLVTFIDQKSQTTIYSWLVLIIEYADLVTKTVEANLSEVPPSMFGIIIDGRTFLSEHFVAIFAVFDHDDRVEKGILPFYKRDTSNISYLVGDNCSVNTKLADLLEAPFIGSASHRLDLAVNLFLSQYAPQLEQVQQLMQKLRGLNKAAKLLLLDVRDIFDALIKKHPAVGTYLTASAAIVKDPDFESACVLALSGRIEELMGDQQLILHPFETTPQAVIADSTTGRPQSFVDKVLAARKK
ncbi:hypothetical protein GQ600_24863 [Phytophthora cactorum]|nr:hypothetical protein GQ600_24863 [Phytophthora cactorum]